MKKILYSLVLLTIVVVGACRKSDNPTMPDGIVYINQPTIKKESGDLAIKSNNPAAFTAKFSVDLYFKDTEKPKYLDIVVVKNGNAKGAKVIKKEVSTYPTQIDLKGSDLISMFGQIAVGDNFDIGANYITNDGKTYLAFPFGGGVGYGSNVSGQPGASPTIRFSCICGFDMDTFLGDGKFKIVADGWDDFGAGSVVTIKKVDATTMSIDYTPVSSFKPIIIKVNADNTANVAKQILGDTKEYGQTYGNLSIESKGGGISNYINPCAGQIVLFLSYTVSAGSFGDFAFELEKVK